MEKAKRLVFDNIVWIAILGMIVVFFAIAMQPRQAEAPTMGIVDTSSPMARGIKNAKVNVVQYSDFMCPYCSYFSTSVMPKIDKAYITTKQIAFEFRPVAFVAEGSQETAEGAYCAIDQNKFWQYHDAVYQHVWDTAFSKGIDPRTTTVLTPDALKEVVATKVELDASEFNTCLDTKKYEAKVKQVTAKAQANGVSGTPYILVNGKPVRGTPSFEVVNGLIKAEL